jgi:rhodanese-related sulfurtransferase
MLLKTLLTAFLAALFSFGAAAGHDLDLAASYARLFQPVQGAAAGKALHLMPMEKFIQGLQSGKPMVALDVRTPGETRVFGMTMPGSLAIPANEVFLEENLARIPTDRTVVVICQAGVRAAIVGTALRHVGYDNVYVLKGGLKGLSAALNCKAANAPPEKAAP